MLSKNNILESQDLYKAILSLTTVEECSNLFDDLCTIKEIQDLTQRFAVAKMLKNGANYQEVSKATGASTATICRVNKCLMYGSNGYNNVLSKLESGEDNAN